MIFFTVLESHMVQGFFYLISQKVKVAAVDLLGDRAAMRESSMKNELPQAFLQQILSYAQQR